jgi:hypothetical protein
MRRRAPEIEVHIEQLVLHGLSGIDASALAHLIGVHLTHQLQDGPFGKGPTSASPRVYRAEVPERVLGSNTLASQVADAIQRAADRAVSESRGHGPGHPSGLPTQQKDAGGGS